MPQLTTPAYTRARARVYAGVVSCGMAELWRFPLAVVRGGGVFLAWGEPRQ